MGRKTFKEGCRRQVPYSPEGMVHRDFLRHHPLSTPTLGARPESGTCAKENQMGIALEEAKHQVNQKFNKSEKKLQYSGLLEKA